MPSSIRGTRQSPVELRWQIWLPWLALATLLLAATRTDPDLWGHVRFGLDWLQARDLPTADPYSYLQDRPWVNHEWLSEAAMAAAYQADAIGRTRGAENAGRRRRNCGHRLAPARREPGGVGRVLTVAIVGALPLSGTVRPQIWSALALALLMPVLTLEPPTAARAGGTAVLFGIWANLHGGWITGGAALALHALLRAVRAPKHAVKWMGLGLGCLLATFGNPYGIGLWRFLATTGTRLASRCLRMAALQPSRTADHVGLGGRTAGRARAARSATSRRDRRSRQPPSCCSSWPLACASRVWRRWYARARSRFSPRGSAPHGAIAVG